MRFLFLTLVFVREKATVYENISFTDQASGFRLPDCFKLDIKGENDNDARICQHDVIVKFIYRFQVSFQYHHWFCCYDNFRLEEIDQKYRNWKHQPLDFA